VPGVGFERLHGGATAVGVLVEVVQLRPICCSLDLDIQSCMAYRPDGAVFSCEHPTNPWASLQYHIRITYLRPEITSACASHSRCWPYFSRAHSDSAAAHILHLRKNTEAENRNTPPGCRYAKREKSTARLPVLHAKPRKKTTSCRTGQAARRWVLPSSKSSSPRASCKVSRLFRCRKSQASTSRQDLTIEEYKGV
jgi:hypothetical protein